MTAGSTLYLAATGISPIFGKAGMHFAYHDMLYHNQRDGGFAPVDQELFGETAQPTMGFSTADYDRDGRVDYALTWWNEPPSPLSQQRLGRRQE